MANEPVLLDAGPLVAILRKDDPAHNVCVAAATQLWRPMYTCWPVITEAAWLLRGNSSALDGLFANLERGHVQPLPLDDRAGP
jgi:uncharacterized protein